MGLEDRGGDSAARTTVVILLPLIDEFRGPGPQGTKHTVHAALESTVPIYTKHTSLGHRPDQFALEARLYERELRVWHTTTLRIILLIDYWDACHA